jgi:dipeptidyl aminopeptidase/acylaminoacyl peptidase
MVMRRRERVGKRRRPWVLLSGVMGACLAAGPAARAAPSIAEIVEVADIDSLSASPDGRRVAFRVQRASIDRNSYALDWHVADLATGLSARVAGGGGPIYGEGGPIDTEPVFWSKDGRFFFHRALVDGAIGIWRTAADGSGSRPVVIGDSDVERLEAAPDAEAVFYHVGPTRAEIVRAEQREYDEGVLIDGSVDVSQALVRGASIKGRLATQRLVGTWYSRGELMWRAGRLKRRLDLATLVSTDDGIVTPPPAVPLATIDFDVNRSARVPSGASATLRRSVRGRSTLEARTPGSTGTLTCRDPVCREGRLVALEWRPGHDQLLFTVQDPHQLLSLHLWDVATGKVRRIAGGDGLLAGSRESSVPCALVRDAALCVSAGAVSPPRLERVDLRSGRRTLVFDPNAELRRRDAPEVEHVSLKLADGRPVAATLLKPRGAPPEGAPLFIHYYFCPGYLRGGIGDELPLIPLAHAGFVVACVNMAPSERADDGMGRYRDSLASVRALVDRLAARGLIDRRRVGMAGFSAGSEATMFTAMNSKLLAAAAIASPQYEPASYWLNNVRGRDFAGPLRFFYRLGSPEETPERWRLVAPALNVGKIEAPLLMQLPEQETRHVMELYGRLSNSATPVELFGFPDESHFKMQPRHRQAAHRRYLDWFRYWLQGHADNDPARADQYRRWDLLRKRRSVSAE